MISSISDKAVPLNQYANDCGVAQNCQIGRNSLHRADQNNKGEKVREQRDVGEDGARLEEEVEHGRVEIRDRLGLAGTPSASAEKAKRECLQMSVCSPSIKKKAKATVNA